MERIGLGERVVDKLRNFREWLDRPATEVLREWQRRFEWSKKEAEAVRREVWGEDEWFEPRAEVVEGDEAEYRQLVIQALPESLNIRELSDHFGETLLSPEDLTDVISQVLKDKITQEADEGAIKEDQAIDRKEQVDHLVKSVIVPFFRGNYALEDLPFSVEGYDLAEGLESYGSATARMKMVPVRVGGQTKHFALLNTPQSGTEESERPSHLQYGMGDYLDSYHGSGQHAQRLQDQLRASYQDELDSIEDQHERMQREAELGINYHALNTVMRGMRPLEEVKEPVRQAVEAFAKGDDSMRLIKVNEHPRGGDTTTFVFDVDVPDSMRPNFLQGLTLDEIDAHQGGVRQIVVEADSE